MSQFQDRNLPISWRLLTSWCSLAVALTFAVVACSTGGAKKAEDEHDLMAVSTPTYDEKVSTIAIDQQKSGVCPTGDEWQSLEWKKILPLANICAEKRDWYKVESLGKFLSTNAYLTPWGPYYLSLAAEARKDYPRARWMLELALKKAPNEGLFHYELGRILWEQGFESDSVAHFKQASSLNPSLVGAHWIMGQIAVARQDYSQAEGYFEQALSKDPQHWQSLFSMAALKIKSKDWQKAGDYLKRVLASNSACYKARLALAELQENHLSQPREALQSYKTIQSLAATRKLDEAVSVNLEERIQSLERAVAKISSAKPDSAHKKADKMTIRQVSSEKEADE